MRWVESLNLASSFMPVYLHTRNSPLGALQRSSNLVAMVAMFEFNVSPKDEYEVANDFGDERVPATGFS